MTFYTKQQSRFASAFVHRSCSTDCVCICGRVHFTSAIGCGDYDEGVLERLKRKARKDSNYVECREFDRIDIAMLDGREYVVHCECRRYEVYLKFIEDHAGELATYLSLFFKDRIAELQTTLESDQRAQKELEQSLQLPSSML